MAWFRRCGFVLAKQGSEVGCDLVCELASRISQSTILAPVMVAIAQLVERQIVVLDVAGSNPVSHP